ncbi:MAG TPA: hypothetical protein VLI69_04990 [Gammaproteobacteria bacterium]|nr:hypothetical protein [Gammaproteobacteria bacterium]
MESSRDHRQAEAKNLPSVDELRAEIKSIRDTIILGNRYSLEKTETENLVTVLGTFEAMIDIIFVQNRHQNDSTPIDFKKKNQYQYTPHDKAIEFESCVPVHLENYHTAKTNALTAIRKNLLLGHNYDLFLISLDLDNENKINAFLNTIPKNKSAFIFIHANTHDHLYLYSKTENTFKKLLTLNPKEPFLLNEKPYTLLLKDLPCSHHAICRDFSAEVKLEQEEYKKDNKSDQIKGFCNLLDLIVHPDNLNLRNIYESYDVYKNMAREWNDKNWLNNMITTSLFQPFFNGFKQYAHDIPRIRLFCGSLGGSPDASCIDARTRTALNILLQVELEYSVVMECIFRSTILPVRTKFTVGESEGEAYSYFWSIAAVLFSNYWDLRFLADTSVNGIRKKPGILREEVLFDKDNGVLKYLSILLAEPGDDLSFLDVLHDPRLKDKQHILFEAVLNEKEFLKTLKPYSDEEKKEERGTLSFNPQQQEKFDELIYPIDTKKKSLLSMALEQHLIYQDQAELLLRITSKKRLEEMTTNKNQSIFKQCIQLIPIAKIKEIFGEIIVLRYCLSNLSVEKAIEIHGMEYLINNLVSNNLSESHVKSIKKFLNEKEDIETILKIRERCKENKQPNELLEWATTPYLVDNAQKFSHQNFLKIFEAFKNDIRQPHFNLLVFQRIKAPNLKFNFANLSNDNFKNLALCFDPDNWINPDNPLSLSNFLFMVKTFQSPPSISPDYIRQFFQVNLSSGILERVETQIFNNQLARDIHEFLDIGHKIFYNENTEEKGSSLHNNFIRHLFEAPALMRAVLANNNETAHLLKTIINNPKNNFAEIYRHIKPSTKFFDCVMENENLIDQLHFYPDSLCVELFQYALNKKPSPKLIESLLLKITPEKLYKIIKGPQFQSIFIKCIQLIPIEKIKEIFGEKILGSILSNDPNIFKNYLDYLPVEKVVEIHGMEHLINYLFSNKLNVWHAEKISKFLEEKEDVETILKIRERCKVQRNDCLKWMDTHQLVENALKFSHQNFLKIFEAFKNDTSQSHFNLLVLLRARTTRINFRFNNFSNDYIKNLTLFLDPDNLINTNDPLSLSNFLFVVRAFQSPPSISPDYIKQFFQVNLSSSLLKRVEKEILNNQNNQIAGDIREFLKIGHNIFYEENIEEKGSSLHNSFIGHLFEAPALMTKVLENKDDTADLLKTMTKNPKNNFSEIYSHIEPTQSTRFFDIVMENENFINQLHFSPDEKEKLDSLCERLLQYALNKKLSPKLIESLLLKITPEKLYNIIEGPQFFCIAEILSISQIFFILKNTPKNMEAATKHLTNLIIDTGDFKKFLELRELLCEKDIIKIKNFSLRNIKKFAEFPSDQFQLFFDDIKKIAFTDQIARELTAGVNKDDPSPSLLNKNLSLVLSAEELANFCKGNPDLFLAFLLSLQNSSPLPYLKTFVNLSLTEFLSPTNEWQSDKLCRFLTIVNTALEIAAPLEAKHQNEEKNNNKEMACHPELLKHLGNLPDLGKCLEFIATLSVQSIHNILHSDDCRGRDLLIKLIPLIDSSKQTKLFNPIFHDEKYKEFLRGLPIKTQITLLSRAFEKTEIKSDPAADACLKKLIQYLPTTDNQKRIQYAAEAMYLLTRDSIDKVKILAIAASIKHELSLWKKSSTLAKYLEDYATSAASPYHAPAFQQVI